MEAGVLYISTSYSLAGHICPCGCGREVTNKLSLARWRVIYDGEVSLKPSIASTAFPCNSHYFITRGSVDWHPQLNTGQVEKARAADRRTSDHHRAPAAPSTRRVNWWKRFWGGSG
ncbi:DUF6527 family protein [Arthrobacter sp. Soc17.1.1.1]|uniref:DUF6527 family protein n=1 Tax=Arthrobacter sp. Soc17.1.1.1 TaxID=3121277 RepID=UPI003FA54652